MIKSVYPEEFNKLIEYGEYDYIIDIRTQQELDYFWIISGITKHLDVYTEIDKILALDKNKKYLIYCYHWNRSWMLLQYMEQSWFKNVVDLYWWIDARMQNWFKLVPYK